MSVLLSIGETALAYEDGWCEYTRVHKKPRRKADFDSYIDAAHSAGWRAINKAQLRRVVEWLETKALTTLTDEPITITLTGVKIFYPQTWQELLKETGE